MKRKLVLGLLLLGIVILGNHFWKKSQEIQKVDIVVFSFDRPMQLYAFLESSHTYFRNIGQISVICRSSNPEFEKGYEEVQKDFPNLKFLVQGKRPENDFKLLTLKAVYGSPSSHVMFAVDDIIVKDEVDLAQCVRAMNKQNAYGFYLRLGENIDFSYNNNASNQRPASLSIGSDMHMWIFSRNLEKGEWSYSNNVDCTIYNKKQIASFLKKNEYNTPNQMESLWAQHANFKKKGLYFTSSKVLNIPVNIVNQSVVNTVPNRTMDLYTPYQLLGKFNQGLKIDISPFKKMNNRSPHVEQEISFIKRKGVILREDGLDFDVLMGKNSKHWEELKGKKDKEFLEWAKGVYDQGLQEDKQESRIPHTVHFIWLGPRAFPPESVANIRMWIAKNPDWTFKFWTDRERDPPCQGMEKVVLKNYPFSNLKKCYVSSRNWGEKSDILRYEILYKEGGVYVDHDANCLKSFDQIHNSYDFYCGLEAPHPPLTEFSITAGNGVIGAKEGHPFIKRLMEMIEERWNSLGEKYSGKDGFSKSQLVMERTYLALTLVLHEWKEGKISTEERRNIIFPAAYFFAKPGIEPLYSKHFFANTWAGPQKGRINFERKTTNLLNKIEKRMNKINWGVLFIVGFSLPLIGYAMYRSGLKRSGKKGV